LHVVPFHERRQQGAVRRLKVARRGFQHEGRDDQHPEVERPGQPRHCDGNEDDAAYDIRGHHQATPVAPVRDEAAVEPEEERRDAVREADGEHAERSGVHEREPHQCDVVERVPELADHHRGVRPAKVAPSQESQGALRRDRRGEFGLLGPAGERFGHADEFAPPRLPDTRLAARWLRRRRSA